jgi:acyl phosphate:glycerol-3-phosphate acyltransferase
VSVPLAALVTLVPAYLLGSMPWGLWIGLLRGADVRRQGSGNLGATNVYRLLGPGLGVLVLVLDAAKGALAVAWGGHGPAASAFPGGPAWAALAAGITAILGHMLSLFARFRGGRGVATTIGVFLALAPWAMLIGLGAFVVAFAFTRRVSVGSLALALVFPIGVLLTVAGPSRTRLFVLAVIAAVLIVLRHIPNIRRLLRGQERTLDLRGRGTAAGGTTPPGTAPGGNPTPHERP